MPTRRRLALPRLAPGSQKELLLSGVPLVMALIAAFVWPGAATAIVVVVLLVPFAVLLHFFRDPERTPPADDSVAVAPADGEVDAVELVHEQTHPGGEALRISIFMSISDVHVNRAPLEGRVTSVQHVPGQFLQAFRAEAAEVNEHNLIGLDTCFGPVLVKQIAGIMARRVVCWVAVGDSVAAGGKIGLVKFGSRVDVFLPVSAEPLVRIGDRTRAGITVIARWQDEDRCNEDAS